MAQLSFQFGGRKTGGTSVQQMFDGGNEVALSRETDVLVPPEALAIETGNIAQGIPLAIVGIAAEITRLFEKAPDGTPCIIQLLAQFRECPAGTLAEELP